MDTAICKEVIITTLSRRGSGKDSTDPIRIITKIWDKDGTLLAERDPISEASDFVSKRDLQDAMIGSSFIATGSEFDAWYNRNFKQ